MARGWESKSVEDQIEEARSRKRPELPTVAPEETARLKQRESVELTRTRVLRDLAEAQNPKYQEMLTKALEHLDAQLRNLE